MPESTRRLVTPLRVSFALHALLLVALAQVAVPAGSAVPRQPMQARLVGVDAPEHDPQLASEATALAPHDPRDVLPEPPRPPEEEVALLPPLEVLAPHLEHDLERDIEHDMTRARRPRPELQVPLPTERSAARRPATETEPTPPARKRTERPAPSRRPSDASADRRAPRSAPPVVVRRPGTLRGYYPPEAQRLGLEGTAYVLVSVDRRGQVASAQLRRSSGHASLDRMALRIARLYEFAPGRPGRVVLPVPFRLL